MASPLLAVPGGDYKSTWPLRPDRSSSNIHRKSGGSNNNRRSAAAGENVSWLFKAEHSAVETLGAVEGRRDSKTAGPGQGSTSSEHYVD